MKKEQELYVLIDSSGILFHQYYGMKNTNFKHTINIKNKEIDLSAIVGYFNFFKKIKEEYNEVPDKNFIHVLDPNGGSDFRKAIYPEYKANRKEKDLELSEQKNLLGSFLKSLDEKFIQIDGVESDDVIGTLSHRLSLNGDLVLIISYDKDLLQLLNENVSLARNEKIAGNDYKVFNFYTHDYIYKNYGFPPETFVDYLAFTGDVSDNIPGVKGIGDKAAKEILKEFINVENVLNNLDKLKPKYRKKIEENIENLILSKKLVAIQKDLKSVPEIDNINTDLNPILKDNLLKILQKLQVIN